VVAYRGIIGNLSYWDPFAWLTFLDPRLQRIICVADAIREYFLRKRFLLFFRLIRPERVVCSYKGHRVEWYDGPVPEPSLRERFGIPPEARVIGCVSRIRARTGISELVACMDLLRCPGEVHLVVLGHLEDRSHLQALRHSKHPERVHLPGFVPDAVRLAGQFDIITLPSLRREGLPRAVIEGMAQGVAPVVTDAGGSPELIEQGVSGLIVPPGDPGALAAAFDQLLTDDGLRRSMGAAARGRIETHFHSDQTLAQTLALYREVTPPER